MASDVPVIPAFATLCDDLIAVGQRFDQNDWVPASGGNFSARIDAQTVVITASGRHKGELTADDFLRCDLQGRVEGAGRSSYETGLHLQLYRRESGIGAVLHNHSVAATVLSRQVGDVLLLQNYELLKLFDGHSDPRLPFSLPVFKNEQNIAALAAEIDQAMEENGTGHAYLIEGHGLYTWGASIQQARLRVEALEFMLACELQQTMQRK